MKLNQQDLKMLRTPLIVFGAALILLTLLVSYAENRKNEAEQALQAQKGQLSQARQRYQTSGQEKDQIVKYLPIYQRMIKDGFIGEERRIEWVDSLRNIHQQHKLYTVNYSIGMQEEYKPAFTLNVGSFKPYRSVMKLELAMLHEGDLLTLIDALDKTETAPFILRQCEITRLSSAKPTNLTPNLLAACELDWLTIREPQLNGVATP
ncbi:MAG TPA: hypothetical protein VK974_11400 [Methylophilaceae bacterium]|nr:hypothetical protein [Methylophilaceae bacterium]